MTQTVEKPTQEKVNSFRYLITKFNKKGWANSDIYLPVPFDLVTMYTHTDKKISGWWNGNNWNGARLKEDDRVLFWKRRLYEHVT